MALVRRHAILEQQSTSSFFISVWMTHSMASQYHFIADAFSIISVVAIKLIKRYESLSWLFISLNIAVCFPASLRPFKLSSYRSTPCLRSFLLSFGRSLCWMSPLFRFIFHLLSLTSATICLGPEMISSRDCDCDTFHTRLIINSTSLANYGRNTSWHGLPATNLKIWPSGITCTTQASLFIYKSHVVNSTSSLVNNYSPHSNVLVLVDDLFLAIVYRTRMFGLWFRSVEIERIGNYSDL